MLIEASAIHRVERWGDMAIQTGHDGGLTSIDPRMISVIESTTNTMFRLNNELNNSWNTNLHYRAALSYITGSHVFKVGFNNAWGYHDNETYSPESIIPGYGPAQGVQYQFTNGAPSAIVLRSHPRTAKVEVDNDLGIFVQDKWTTNRWTLAGGLRYDLYENSFPEQSFAGVTFPKTSNLSWNDITPKLGATYDVRGDGKTAIKVPLNKYLIGLGTSGLFDNAITSRPSPVNHLRTTTNRTWTDANKTSCPTATSTRWPPTANAARGRSPLRHDPGANDYDPDLLTGWNKRNYNWEFSAGVQHELAPRVAVDVSYFRRWYGNFPVWDDRSAGVADYDLAHVTVPVDPNLPDGGGYTVSVYDLKKQNRPALEHQLPRPDGAKSEVWQGIDITGRARLTNGLILQGGMSGGSAPRRLRARGDQSGNPPRVHLDRTNARVLLCGAAARTVPA